MTNTLRSFLPYLPLSVPSMRSQTCEDRQRTTTSLFPASVIPIMATWWLRIPSRLEILLLVQEHNKLRPAPNQQIPVTITAEETFKIQILKQEHDAARQHYNKVQRQAYRLRECIEKVLKFNARTGENEYDHDACIAVTSDFLRRLDKEKQAAEAAEEAALKARLLDEEQREVIQRGRSREPKQLNPQRLEYEDHPRNKLQRDSQVEDVRNIPMRSRTDEEDGRKAAHENHDDQQHKCHYTRKDDKQLQERDGNIKLRIPPVILSQPCRDNTTKLDDPTIVHKASIDGRNATKGREVRNARSAETLEAPPSSLKERTSILKIPAEPKTGFGVSRSNNLKGITGLSSDKELLVRPWMDVVDERQKKTEISLKEAHRRALETYQEVKRYTWRQEASD